MPAPDLSSLPLIELRMILKDQGVPLLTYNHLDRDDCEKLIDRDQYELGWLKADKEDLEKEMSIHVELLVVHTVEAARLSRQIDSEMTRIKDRKSTIAASWEKEKKKQKV
jgi:hypothetical protein